MGDDDLLKCPEFVSWAERLLELSKSRRNAELHKVLQRLSKPKPHGRPKKKSPDLVALVDEAKKLGRKVGKEFTDKEALLFLELFPVTLKALSDGVQRPSAHYIRTTVPNILKGLKNRQNRLGEARRKKKQASQKTP